jgi:ABC-type nitrate/sulfonate/bicarbonate transport system substrate-binding protein
MTYQGTNSLPSPLEHIVPIYDRRAAKKSSSEKLKQETKGIRRKRKAKYEGQKNLEDFLIFRKKRGTIKSSWDWRKWFEKKPLPTWSNSRRGKIIQHYSGGAV